MKARRAGAAFSWGALLLVVAFLGIAVLQFWVFTHKITTP